MPTEARFVLEADVPTHVSKMAILNLELSPPRGGGPPNVVPSTAELQA